MINITPLTIALLQILTACVVYAALWLMLQAWRWFVAFCMEIAE